MGAFACDHRLGPQVNLVLAVFANAPALDAMLRYIGLSRFRYVPLQAAKARLACDAGGMMRGMFWSSGILLLSACAHRRVVDQQAGLAPVVGLEAPPAFDATCVIRSSHLLVIDRIAFPEGDFVLDATSSPLLGNLTDILTLHPEVMHLVVIGHAAPTSDPDVDFRLSLARSLAVWKALLTRGVHPNRVSMEARGAADGLGDFVEFDLIDEGECGVGFRDGWAKRQPVNPWTLEALPWTPLGEEVCADEFGMPIGCAAP